MGTASPPYLVILGLILPDSRMLSGIASIGLTLANIAIILPYLRQSLLDSMQEASEGAPSHAGSQIVSSPYESHPTQPADLGVETLPLVSALPCGNEHPSPHVAHSASAKHVHLPPAVQLESLDFDPGVAPFPILPLPSGNTKDGQPPQSDQPPDADATEKPSSNPLLMRDGRSALYIPLPVPDAAEIAFFDSAATLTSNLDLDLEEASAEQDTLLEEDSSMEDDELIATDNCQPLTTDLLSPPRRILGQGFPANGEMSVPDEYVTYIQTTFPLQSVHPKCSEAGEDEDFAKQRHESLKFIPQSVLSRYPSALVVSAGRCNENNSFGFNNRFASLSIGHNPALLPSGITPQVGHIASEGCWRAAFVTDIWPEGQLIGGQTLVLDATLGQDQASLSEPHTSQDLTTPKKYPSHTKRRRLGVLARATLRNRRFSARRCRGNENDDSSASDSDSDSDSSDSQYSSGSSADSEGILPLMLGADLLAALDANSEPELNLAGPGRRCSLPLTMSEELLVPDGSVADISIVMQVSSIDDSADGEAKVPVTLRSLTYEDIQQWASGVVQKCVRQVYRTRAPADPLQSPSQASDICAEKPSGSGTSQCPFSGLHCKLGAHSSGHGQAPRANEFPLSLPPTLILPARKIRNLRDIPEFIPRQRLVSVTTGRVEGHWKPDTRSTNMDVTRDAADKVIARVESQARFNSRQCLVSVDKRKVSSATRVGHKNV